MGHLGEGVEGDYHVVGHVGHQGEVVYGLRVAYVCVQVGPQLHTEVAQGHLQGFAGVEVGALEQHVLQEVGDSQTRPRFVHRSGLHDQPYAEAFPGWSL